MYLSGCGPFFSGKILPFEFIGSVKGSEEDVLKPTMQQ